MPDEIRSILKIDSLVTGYGKKQIINGVSLDVARGEIVALIGHNGAGKSTLLKAIFGLLAIWEGQVHLNGEHLRSLSPYNLLRAGVAYVPQGNRVFTELTVSENLEMGGITLPNKTQLRERMAQVFTAFPILKARFNQRAGTLSGGEKQMLALANALILSPRLLMLDEPSLGLAPPIAAEALGRLREINNESSTTILVVEQKVREVLQIAHKVYALRNGQVTFSGPAESLNSDAKLKQVYL